MRKCCYCDTLCPDQLMRPYGPNSSYTCYQCAMKPENRQTTDAMYDAAIDAALKMAEQCGPGAIVVGGVEGPQYIPAADKNGPN